MNIQLIGKTALVCGSTQGIGKAAAMELASNGATVILLARNQVSLEKTLKDLPVAHNQQHQCIVTDFNFPDQLRSKVHSFLSEQKLDIQILVNNTGGPPAGPAVNANPEEFILAFANHLLCNHALVQLVVEGMKRVKYGRIINIISTSVKQPIKGLGVSNTIRGAVASWSKTLAGELGPFGITVNNVLPGATNTSRLQALIDSKAEKAGISKEAAMNEWISEIPAGRYAQPEEIANVIAFLASPAAAYVNGINVPVDGGRTACL